MIPPWKEASVTTHLPDNKKSVVYFLTLHSPLSHFGIQPATLARTGISLTWVRLNDSQSAMLVLLCVVPPEFAMTRVPRASHRFECTVQCEMATSVVNTVVNVCAILRRLMAIFTSFSPKPIS